MIEKEIRTLDQNQQMMWWFGRMLCDHVRAKPKPGGRRSYGLLDPSTIDADDGSGPSMAAEARKRAANDGPPDEARIAEAKIVTEHLRQGEWLGDHGIALCPSCYERRLIVSPRKERVEVICLGEAACEYFCVEAMVDGELWERGYKSSDLGSGSDRSRWTGGSLDQKARGLVPLIVLSLGPALFGTSRAPARAMREAVNHTARGAREAHVRYCLPYVGSMDRAQGPSPNEGLAWCTLL
jgi:hypothetical protein